MRAALLCTAVCVSACSAPPVVERDSLEALPAVAPSPADNPLTDAKIELGRLLFWDPVLSGHEDVACATCHHPDFGYGDGLALSIGVGGTGLGPGRSLGEDMPFVPRNAPTVLNTGFNGWTEDDGPVDPLEAPMFWDNRAESLEAQALGPIQNDLEMRGEAYPEDQAIDRVVARLTAIPEYVTRFAEAFDAPASEAVTGPNLGRALAAFERHLSRPNSAYDAWLAGDDDALTARQRRGLDAFQDVGCAECHGGPMFSDFALHDIGAEDASGVPDDGDGTNRFRTPTLRNVALTAPFMHSGHVGDLEDAVEFYDDIEDEDVAEEVQDIELEEDQEEDIAAFLEALTDQDFDRSVPEAVPSGLQPGGAIE